MMKFALALLAASVAYADVRTNAVPSRLHWQNNAGYDGETALISAGLYYGQYVSQYDVRALITPGGDQIGGKLTIGENGGSAAQQLHLRYEEWNNLGDSLQFLAWMKQKLAGGIPVVFGVYANRTLFGPGPMDHADYDHIVCARTILSRFPISHPASYPTDQIGFTDAGLFRPEKTNDYNFHYNIARFQSSRSDADIPTSLVYSLPSDAPNYGIAILGVADLNGDTLPVKLEANPNNETPSIDPNSNMRPASMPLELTITISNLEPGVTYNLYRYNQLASVPESQFNANEAQAFQKSPFSIVSGTTYTMSSLIQTDEVAVYRCVKASAP